VSRTINTTINGPLFLLPTDNPLTITASGGVNATATDAIDGDSSTAWAISNAGTVSSASGYGVSLAGAGSSVTNNPGGSISGTGPAGFNIISGVAITGASGTVTNGGTISVSGGGYGVHLAGGGVVTNSNSITGGEDGVLIEGAPGQINNTGAISASVDDGAALFAGGTITNSATGSIPAICKTMVSSRGITLGPFFWKEAASPTAQATHPPASLPKGSASREQVSASSLPVIRRQ
jgi:hypothetical protein